MLTVNRAFPAATRFFGAYTRANALDNEPCKCIIYNVGISKNSINGNL